MNEETSKVPWYSGGLAFACSRCGHCCTGAPGFVWVTEDELATIAKFLGQPLREVRDRHARKSRGRITLRERANGDCVFFDRQKGCTIYPVRPPQCRTWPFWESNLKTPADWDQTCSICPGSGRGELISAEEIVKRSKVIRL
jgi:uncharacterized protein